MEFRFSTENRATIVFHVTEKLRKAILEGTLKEGERLKQEEWAVILGVSRMPIREALKQLEIEGLVKNEPHKGAIVTPITIADVEEIYHSRALLESLAVEKALPFQTEQDKEEIERVLIKMEELELTPETNDDYIELNSKFHKLLRKGCPWKRVETIVENLGISPIAPSLLSKNREEAKAEHRMIYEALIHNDPFQLRKAMEYHIVRTKNSLITYMKAVHLKRD